MAADVDVTLQPITEHSVAAVFDLKVKDGRGSFVATNPWSLSQALAEYDIAWPRAILAGNEVVGFLMLEIDPYEEDGRPFWLWRLMIDGEHQGNGYGAAASKLAIDEVAQTRRNRAIHLLGAGGRFARGLLHQTWV